MSESAFGIDHGDEVSKAEKREKQPKASAGRKVAGTAFGAWHGGVAGKKGHKLKAIGTAGGSAIGGSLLGSAVAGRAGGLAGSAAGGFTGVQLNQKYGNLKPEEKVHKSAFDVEHIYKAGNPMLGYVRNVTAGAKATGGIHKPGATIGSTAASARRATAETMRSRFPAAGVQPGAGAPKVAGGTPGGARKGPGRLRQFGTRAQNLSTGQKVGAVGGVSAVGGAGAYGASRRKR